ncbi:MAG: OmpA family protein [Bacteroidetes bacterium]|nr:OmpA family protein [Bacteroidota bacterium]
MKKKYSIFLLVSIPVLFSGCVSYYLSKGNKEFETASYIKAIKHYKKSLVRKESAEARTNLAHACRLVNDVKNAEQEYESVIQMPNSESINTFYYAKLLMEEQRYEKAKEQFNLYLKKKPTDIVAKMLLASCNSVSLFKRDTTLYTVDMIDVKNVASIFGCVSYKDGIVCTAEKEVKLNSKKNPWTGKSYLDLYFSQKDKNGKWLSPQLLKGEINGEYHEGPATFNKSGDVVYFTRSNYYKYKLRKSSKNENNLKIFRADLVNSKWTNLEELFFCSDEYSVGHPCLAPDEKTLYFVSDMLGGYGGTDIYLSYFDGGKWLPPMNLGNIINTPGNEMFPFASEDGSFYFSSDAHNSMGGLDVFVSSYQGNKWLRPENLNYPLNTSKDDFAFVLNSDGSTGYISSSRSDTDRVYAFTKNPPTFSIEGIVLDKKTRQPLENAAVVVLENNKFDNIQLTSDVNGRYKTELEADGNYTVLASMKGYFILSEDVDTRSEKYSKTFIVNFDLNEMVIGKSIVLENIYYDLDQCEIRADASKELDKLVKILNDNPTIKIELSSHTDSRAGDQYNLVLSDKRAKAAVNYLISRGIDSKRLTWKGYGETRLVNKCSNGVQCSEEEHQQNRRTEFKVLKIGQHPVALSTK